MAIKAGKGGLGREKDTGAVENCRLGAMENG